jgi:hypothetical protein
MLDGMAAKDCICFPVDEPPHLELKAEIEGANPFAARCTANGSASWHRQSIARRTSSHLYISNWRTGLTGTQDWSCVCELALFANILPS